jgi:CheY-like chemotaxis protein/anti-sigma regulatory factor (Ser/Thr protein kinase)
MNPSPSPVTEPAQTPSAEQKVLTLLIVDDSAMDRHLAGAIVQKLGGWAPEFAGNGVEALDAMARRTPDLVLTDMIMPEMGGLELVQAIRSGYPGVPVILMTAHGSEDIALKALQSGAASYLPKKTLARDLAETIEQVMIAVQSSRDLQRIIVSLESKEMNFILKNDTALIGPLVGYLEGVLTQMKLSDPSGLILVGVALHEALTNAILHGNLELSSELKERDEKEFQRLARERRDQQPYGDRRIFVYAKLTRQDFTFVIRDEGDGFDPVTLPDPTDAANLGRVCGRGLLLIQTFMDKVRHNDKGNEITMIKHCHG